MGVVLVRAGNEFRTRTEVQDRFIGVGDMRSKDPLRHTAN
jgi:hypothetical protein